MRSRILIAAFILSACLPFAGCRRGERAEQAQGPAPCPSLEGSYFGSDKSEVARGEVARLSLKLPREYVNERLRLERAEGGETAAAPFDLAALQAAANPPQLDGAKFPVWIERDFAEVRPERSAKYTLKAAGPEGCQPIELPATVTVVE